MLRKEGDIQRISLEQTTKEPVKCICGGYASKSKSLRTEYHASQNIILLETFLLGLALYFIRGER